jgi:hypothetical protein
MVKDAEATPLFVLPIIAAMAFSVVEVDTVTGPL